jgi:cobalamin biosynthesis protein CobT
LESFTSDQEVKSKAKSSAKKEKLMDPVMLATTVTALVAPYLEKMGESMMEEAGAKLPEKIGKLWGVISNRFKGNPAASGAGNDLVKKADDTDNQEAFALQLKKALKDDEEFANALQAMLKEAQDTISNVGDGAVATNGSIGVGKIEIGGDVSGNIVIGNNNQVSSWAKKKN